MLTSDMNSTFHLSVWQEEHSVFDVEFTASGPAEVQMALENLHQLLNRFAPGEAKPTADLPAKPEPAVPTPQRTGLVPSAGGAKGLLILHCKDCESVFTTFLREPNTAFSCRCGGEIPLAVPMARFQYQCGCCGRSVYGYTNTEEPCLETRCICGNPIALTWVPKLRMYRG